jgi:tRNA (guanine-N7-)-methyltransferase
VFEKLGDQYLVESFPKPTDVLEIGIGNGENLVAEAMHHLDRYYLGVEVYRPGIGNTLLKLQSLMATESLCNVKIIDIDVVDLFEQIPDSSLEEIQIYFPDPWPKRKHLQRRLINVDFVEHCYKRLKLGGVLRIATDWDDYAKQIDGIFTESSKWVRLDEPRTRGVTKFEQRALDAQRTIHDWVFQKV